MGSLLKDAEHWEQRARETQKMVDAARDPDERRLLMELAASYVRLAERVRKRLSSVD